MENFQKLSLKIFITSALLLMFVGILSAGNFYIQLGIKPKILAYFEINILLVCVLVMTGMICLGIVIKLKPVRVIFNILILFGLILFLLYSFITRIDTHYTEFYSESGKEKLLVIESTSSEIYQVRGGIFLHRLGELPADKDNWHPVERGEYSIHWENGKQMTMISSDGREVEMSYK